MKLTLPAQKDYTLGADFAVNRANLVNGNMQTAQSMGVNQAAVHAQKGRSTWTGNIILINAEDVDSVMEGMVWKWKQTAPGPRTPSVNASETSIATRLPVTTVTSAPRVNMESLNHAHQPAIPNARRKIPEFISYGC